MKCLIVLSLVLFSVNALAFNEKITKKFCLSTTNEWSGYIKCQVDISVKARLCNDVVKTACYYLSDCDNNIQDFPEYLRCLEDFKKTSEWIACDKKAYTDCTEGVNNILNSIHFKNEEDE